MAVIAVTGQVLATSSALGDLSGAHLLLRAETVIVSSASGSLDSQPQFSGSIATTSSASGSLDSQPQFSGSIATTSSAAGVLVVATSLAGSVAAPSSAAGAMSIMTQLAGSVAATSNAAGVLVVATQFVGNVAASSSAAGVLVMTWVLVGVEASMAGASGDLTVSQPIGWLGLTNTVTNAFSGFADNNSLSIRFENDPRVTPSSAWWLTLKVEHDSAGQRETAIKKFRHGGLIKVTIADQLQKGAYHLYEIADLISEMFSGKELADNISLGPAQLQRVGRDGTKSVLDVVFTFQHDF